MNQLQVFFYISVIPLTDTGCFDSSSFSCSSSSSRILTVTQMEQNNCRKIGSFLGAEANKSKDEHDDEDDSLIYFGIWVKLALMGMRLGDAPLPFGRSAVLI
jgi:hypothetical protein